MSVWRRKLVGYRIWLRDLCTGLFVGWGKPSPAPSYLLRPFWLLSLSFIRHNTLNTLSTIKPILHSKWTDPISQTLKKFLTKKFHNEHRALPQFRDIGGKTADVKRMKC